MAGTVKEAVELYKDGGLSIIGGFDAKACFF